MGGSWGEGLLYELLEGTDSEAAVAHIGVRGTLSLHLGGQSVAGDKRMCPQPSLTLARPFLWGVCKPDCPREGRESLPSHLHPHSGHPLQLH